MKDNNGKRLLPPLKKSVLLWCMKFPKIHGFLSQKFLLEIGMF